MPAVLNDDSLARLTRAGRVRVEPEEDKAPDDAAILALSAQVTALQGVVAALSRELNTRLDATNKEQISAVLRNALTVNERAAEAMLALSEAMSKEAPEPGPLPDPVGATWEMRLPGVGFGAVDRVVTIKRTA